MDTRLNKYIALSGVCSRRKADELIKNGKVKINGIVVTELATIVKNSDEVIVDNKVLEKETKVYYVLNKPSGYVSTTKDELNRKCVLDLFPEEISNERIYPIGRLDYDTQGVLLFTNDGDFMNLLVGPTSGIEKEYEARVKGNVEKEDLEVFYKGMKLDGKKLLPARYKIISHDKEHDSSFVSVTITEGKYHQVKKMFEAIGHPVKKLNRVRFGCITNEGLAIGDIRRLTPHEVKELRELAKLNKNIRERNIK